MRQRQATPSQAARVILVFGEDENDTKAVRELMLAIAPEISATIKILKRPPVYAKRAAPSIVRNRVADMCALIRAEEATSTVVGVLVHRDCDAVEPAHKAEAEAIESDFRRCGFEVRAVTPAWEMEAWLFLWPQAVMAYRPSWNKIGSKYAGRNVGHIANAKEEFKRVVQPSGRPGRGYRESDSPGIFRKVRELGLIGKPTGRSDSFLHFSHAVRSFEQPRR
jgi:hypothetical protein